MQDPTSLHTRKRWQCKVVQVRSTITKDWLNYGLHCTPLQLQWSEVHSRYESRYCCATSTIRKDWTDYGGDHNTQAFTSDTCPVMFNTFEHLVFARDTSLLDMQNFWVSQGRLSKLSQEKTSTNWMGKCCNSPSFNTAYLIFVIFFTQTKILDRKFYTKERVIYGKQISRQNSINCDLLAHWV